MFLRAFCNSASPCRYKLGALDGNGLERAAPCFSAMCGSVDDLPLCRASAMAIAISVEPSRHHTRPAQNYQPCVSSWVARPHMCRPAAAVKKKSGRGASKQAENGSLTRGALFYVTRHTETHRALHGETISGAVARARTLACGPIHIPWAGPGRQLFRLPTPRSLVSFCTVSC